MDYVALKSELENDPTGVGYRVASVFRDDMALADLLNLDSAAIRINRVSVPSQDVASAIDPADLLALTDSSKLMLIVMLSGGIVNVASPNVRTLLASLFQAGSATRNNLAALRDRSGSRAEQVLGSAVTHTDVARALR